MDQLLSDSNSPPFLNKRGSFFAGIGIRSACYEKDDPAVGVDCDLYDHIRWHK